MPPGKDSREAGSAKAGMPQPRIDGVPNSPKTPHHSFRCPDDLWEAAKSMAESGDKSLAEVLRAFLRFYVDGDKDEALALFLETYVDPGERSGGDQ